MPANSSNAINRAAQRRRGVHSTTAFSHQAGIRPMPVLARATAAPLTVTMPGVSTSTPRPAGLGRTARRGCYHRTGPWCRASGWGGRRSITGRPKIAIATAKAGPAAASQVTHRCPSRRGLSTVKSLRSSLHSHRHAQEVPSASPGRCTRGRRRRGHEKIHRPVPPPRGRRSA